MPQTVLLLLLLQLFFSSAASAPVTRHRLVAHNKRETVLTNRLVKFCWRTWDPSFFSHQGTSTSVVAATAKYCVVVQTAFSTVAIMHAFIQPRMGVYLSTPESFWQTRGQKLQDTHWISMYPWEFHLQPLAQKSGSAMHCCSVEPVLAVVRLRWCSSDDMLITTVTYVWRCVKCVGHIEPTTSRPMFAHYRRPHQSSSLSAEHAHCSASSQGCRWPLRYFGCTLCHPLPRLFYLYRHFRYSFSLLSQTSLASQLADYSFYSI